MERKGDSGAQMPELTRIRGSEAENLKNKNKIDAVVE